jgi:hypothetical protein
VTLTVTVEVGRTVTVAFVIVLKVLKVTSLVGTGAFRVDMLDNTTYDTELTRS